MASRRTAVQRLASQDTPPDVRTQVATMLVFPVPASRTGKPVNAEIWIRLQEKKSPKPLSIHAMAATGSVAQTLQPETLLPLSSQRMASCKVSNRARGLP